jgi:hypothetical protein
MNEVEGADRLPRLVALQVPYEVPLRLTFHERHLPQSFLHFVFTQEKMAASQQLANGVDIDHFGDGNQPDSARIATGAKAGTSHALPD